MKLKDIQVGEEYAVGNPARPYLAGRYRVVAVGVYGLVREKDSNEKVLSGRPDYVEIELVKGSAHTGDLPWHATVEVLKEDLSHEGGWDRSQRAGDPYVQLRFGNRERARKTRKAIRVPSRYFKRTWAEEARAIEWSKENDARLARERKAREGQMAVALKTINSHAGTRLSTYRDESVTVNLADLELIAHALVAAKEKA